MSKNKVWWPQPLYEMRPRVALVTGIACCMGGFGLSLRTGHWTAVTTLLIGVGAILCIYGAVVLQMRREYRERSKWARQRDGAGR